MYPSIAVEIICKNEENVIARCLEAIEKQLTSNDELIVIDTGSTDNTLAVIKTFFPNVKIYHYEWNDDFASARNYGFSLTDKDWIFCIDSDEVLQSNGLLELKKSITQVEEKSSNPVVFCPKVRNIDDSIVYNAGRVLKNNGKFEFYGIVHEYPIYLNDLSGKNYTTIQLPDVTMVHDGYKEETIIKKSKAKRNSQLDKKMLEAFPNSDRYFYFYYRDAKTLMSGKDYSDGLKEFFKKFPDSDFASQVYVDLIMYYLSNSNTEEAEIYLEKYWECIKKIPNTSNITLVYLTVQNEIQKIINIEKELIKTLEATKINLPFDEDRTIENGYMLDDTIGFLNWRLGEISEAKKINDQLETVGFKGMLGKLLEKS